MEEARLPILSESFGRRRGHARGLVVKGAAVACVVAKKRIALAVSTLDARRSMGL
jgi:hypothetical protein